MVKSSMREEREIMGVEKKKEQVIKFDEPPRGYIMMSGGYGGASSSYQNLPYCYMVNVDTTRFSYASNESWLVSTPNSN